MYIVAQFMLSLFTFRFLLCDGNEVKSMGIIAEK